MSNVAHYTTKLFGLEGKCVLVTGGTSGIGKSIVEEFAKLGASVFTCARDEQALAKVVADLKHQGHAVDGCRADVSSSTDAEDLVAKATDHFGGKLDVLINNVGTNRRKTALDATAEDLTFLMNTNVQSALHLSQLCHPWLTQAEAASIIFNTSVAGGPQAYKSGCMYAMTKASLNQLAKSLACEWAKDGIRVNAVAPWYTATPAATALLQGDPDFEAVVLGRTPLGRIGETAEIAAVMAFLASRAASYVTGQIIKVDGGHEVMGIYAEGKGDAGTTGGRY
eukprot:jgi/Ulvmu1/386/UM001_0393.1